MVGRERVSRVMGVSWDMLEDAGKLSAREELRLEYTVINSPGFELICCSFSFP